MNLTSIIDSEGKIRKLQVVGRRTFSVSLPREWVTKRQLGQGSQIQIHSLEDGALILSPVDLKTQKLGEALIRVTSDDQPSTIIRMIISSYLASFSSIVVKSNKAISREQRDAIKAIVHQRLVGAEIMVNTATEIRLQVLQNFIEMSIQSALRRMEIVTASMLKDLVSSLRDYDLCLAKEVISMDNEVDRFNLYVTRQLELAAENIALIRKFNLDSFRDLLGYRLVTKFH
ncbi:MAG: hypothetical protein QG670_2549 [Thermoproteota archaeon]|nr:hypothetical protein [Thermoproteota archaeon]